MLADHPVLDLLNTVPRIDGELVDSLQSNTDALAWLERAGWPLQQTPAGSRSPALLQSIRNLREVIRTLIEKRKAGKPIDATPLNAFLAKSQSHLELSSEKNGPIKLERRWKQTTPEQILAPLAEAAAELLATADFNLIRRCEDKDCVLWFYDRTRSHHRRWCSMATCGNRNKVASFRQRQQNS